MTDRVLSSRLKFLRLDRQLQEARIDAADLRRLLWVLADKAGGTLTITLQDLQRFDVRGALHWRNDPASGDCTITAKRRTQ